MVSVVCTGQFHPPSPCPGMHEKLTCMQPYPSQLHKQSVLPINLLTSFPKKTSISCKHPLAARSNRPGIDSQFPNAIYTTCRCHRIWKSLKQENTTSIHDHYTAVLYTSFFLLRLDPISSALRRKLQRRLFFAPNASKHHHVGVCVDETTTTNKIIVDKPSQILSKQLYRQK